MKHRRLTAEEKELWKKVAAKAEPLHAKRRDPLPEPTPAQKPKGKTDPRPAEKPEVRPFRIGQTVASGARPHSLDPGVSQNLAHARVQMDHKAFKRLKRGKMAPEGRIDLHGMTLAQAFPALTGFILQSHTERKRLVLVITGKGKSKPDIGPIPERQGALRHQVPQWLDMQPMARCVLQVVEAHRSHGGGGAYYVYLKRH